MPDSATRACALQGVRVLVTRPREQAQNLAALIEQEGGEAIRFPTIEIAEPRILARHRQLPPALRIACIGRGSARELQRLGVEKIIVPAERFDSEALLKLAPLQQPDREKIVIFRGEGGRELLAETLKARGAHVEYAACYRRIRPSADVTPVLDQGIHIISVTSSDGLHNLLDMTEKSQLPRLLRIPIVVVSQRQARLGRELGFTTVLLADQASDEAILQAIQAWRLTQKTL
ncbi:MAG: uroporphyrinogen-III synthase [Gammaproteobacteria bacterium]|nr:uroporphyrinogen-III synthase [Gammaproteobacteria bacterium]